MVNNQEKFNRKFSKEKKIIDFKYKEFQGQLIIENYPRLEEIYLLRVKSIDKIVLKDLTQLQECTIWDCGVNDLAIENCPQINKINVRNNLLTSLKFLESLENLEEIDLDIGCNDFLKSELDAFSGIITKLHNLNIGNSLRRKALQGKYNRFFGSLEYLEKAKKLRELDISNTNIDQGLEYLPESLKKISCSNDLLIPLIRENNCSKVARELKDYRISGNCYDLTLWRNSQPFYRTTSRIENSNQLVASSTQNEQREFSPITIGSISINQGSVLINNELGDNIDLSHRSISDRAEAIESENSYKAQIEVNTR